MRDQVHAPASLAPGRLSVPIEREVGQTPETTWTFRRRETCLATAGVIMFIFYLKMADAVINNMVSGGRMEGVSLGLIESTIWAFLQN